jgi:hypothetical protein
LILTEKCVQTYFFVRKIMKLICNKLGNEYQHMFLASHEKKIYFLFVRTYLTPI